MRKYVIALTIIAGLLVLGYGVYAFIQHNQDEMTENEVITGTVYTNVDTLEGGRCAYKEYVAADGRQTTGTCVDPDSVDKALESLQVNRSEYDGKKIGITGAYHIEIESLTPSTETPQYEDTEVIYFDTITDVVRVDE